MSRTRKLKKLSKKLADVETKQRSCEKNLKDLEDKIEMMERDKRRKTILIEGVEERPENTPENVVIDLFRDIGLERGLGDIDTFYRRGKLTENSQRPRPIVVSFLRLSDKHLMFKSLYKLKENKAWKFIYINDDLTERQLSDIRDLKALNALARSQGTNSFMKGNHLVINGQRFNSENLDKLPKNLSMEKTKNRLVDDKKGLAFQGHHSVFSNMAECDLIHGGHLFTSSESAFQYEKAKICGAKKEEREILKAGSYKAKSIGKSIKENKEWEAKRLDIMYNITLEKFKQNDDMKAKLVATENLRLCEATPSKYWGCGIPMSKLNEIKEGNICGANKMGQILEKIRSELKD